MLIYVTNLILSLYLLVCQSIAAVVIFICVVGRYGLLATQQPLTFQNASGSCGISM